MAASVTEWDQWMIELTDTLDMIMQVAHAKGAQTPLIVLMRAEVWQRVCKEREWPCDEVPIGTVYVPPDAVAKRLPIQVSDSIPLFPGFQIHRDYR